MRAIGHLEAGITTGCCHSPMQNALPLVAMEAKIREVAPEVYQAYLWTSGHTPGHCCFYLPQGKVLIVGDHLLPKITPHIGVYAGGPENTITVQIEGQATMHRSPSVRRFAEQCLTGGMMVLYVDLRHCTHMDSTFLVTGQRMALLKATQYRRWRSQ